MADDTLDAAVGAAAPLTDAMDGVQRRTRDLESGANGFARAMTQAFAGSVTGGKQFDSVLKSLALNLSNMAVKAAFRPLTSALSGGLQQLFGGLFGSSGGGADAGGGTAAELAASMGAIKPFAAGGVVGTPTYFPLSSGGLGLAGEAGPEAILPLARGSDGRLGVTTGASPAAGNVAIHISTPDAESFRRSEAYITGQIARAVARGQRSL
jgi:lambda family phage tail tape measure protein